MQLQASAREGDDIRPGKPATSSSFIELPSVMGEEGLEGAAFSKTPRTEVEPGRVGEAADKPGTVCLDRTNIDIMLGQNKLSFHDEEKQHYLPLIQSSAQLITA